MSTTPVRITLSAYEWGIIADMLEDAACDADDTGRIMFAASAHSYSNMIDNKIKDR